MTLHEISFLIHALLSGFTPWHGDAETHDQRAARLGIIATSIAIASDGNRERALALTVQHINESNLAAHVHRGECERHAKSRRGECDAAWVRIGGKRVRVYKARGLPQVHRAPWRKDLAALWDASLGDGLAPTLAAARLADYYLQARRCKTLAEMYGSQSGRGCVTTASSEKRARMHVKLRAQWARLEKEIHR